MTASKEPGQDTKYFGFPSTLLTLVGLVEDRIAKQADSFSEVAKDALGTIYSTLHNSTLHKTATTGSI